jgi:hypothetical protein
MIPGTTAILILIALAGVHIYWAAGGKAGKAGAVPSLDNCPVLKPSSFATGFVVHIAVWLMAAVFALRAVGDFRYVGFFKRVRDSRFSRLDTWAYSPLCACLAGLIALSATS